MRFMPKDNMNFTTRKQLLKSAFLFISLASANSAFSQAAAPGGREECHCSNPVNVHIVKNSGPTSPVASDFRADMRLNQQGYNATQPNTHFADTLQWKMPASKTCELTGKLSVKLKNLGTSLSSNDTAGVFSGGRAVPGFSQSQGQVWSSGQGAGATRTLTYQLTGAMMHQGRLSFFVQDDTAVQEMRLDITGCCITPTT